MKWTYLLSQKFKVAVSLTVIIVMVLMTNFLNKRHFGELQQSFSSVYEDRLLVQIYIYKIANQLHEKKQLWNDIDHNNISSILALDENIDSSVHTLIEDYENTVLTEKESILFSQLKEKLAELSILEKSIFSQVGQPDYLKASGKASEMLDEISTNLDQLSNIQQEEGLRLIDKSKQIVASSKMASKVELIILIVIGLVVQALLFSSKSSVSKINQNSRLN